MPGPKSRRKTSFVPRAVFRVAVTGASVVPICVTAALGSLEPGCSSVANISFADGGDSTDVADTSFSDVGHKHDVDVLPDAGVADIGFSDAMVADIGFADSSGDVDGAG